jgi:hypothetical protein
MPNPGLYLQVDHALSSNDQKRRNIVALLNNEDQTITVDREFLSSLYSRLGNDSLIMQKLAQELRTATAPSDS